MKKTISLLMALVFLLSLAACGGSGGGSGGNNEILGLYNCSVIDLGMGAEWVSAGEGVSLELKSGGNAVFKSDDENVEYKWTVKGTELTLNASGLIEFKGEVRKDIIILDLLGMKYWLLKPGAVVPTDMPEVKEFSWGDDDNMGDGEGILTQIPVPSTWYGTISITNAFGEYSNVETDIWAFIDESDGQTYFEVYETPNPGDEDDAILSMWIEVFGGTIMPEIGDDDAWIFDQYLDSSDEWDFTTTLFEGALNIYYYYESEDGESGADLEFVLYMEDAA